MQCGWTPPSVGVEKLLVFSRVWDRGLYKSEAVPPSRVMQWQQVWGMRSAHSGIGPVA
jgi:hypothetical protein